MSSPWMLELDRRLEHGPGMRLQRLVEAGFLLAAFFLGEPAVALVTLGLTTLQTLSPRLALVALAVAALHRGPAAYRLGDLYFDLAGSRGACAASVLVQAGGLWALREGWTATGWFILAVPTASFVLAPTLGFCCGCAFYVLGREVARRLGVAEKLARGAHDVDIGLEASADPQ